MPQGSYLLAGYSGATRPNAPLRYAKGMAHLFDEISLKQASTVRLRVVGCFSCERYYYHCRKGERLITPEEQRRIARVFKAAGIETKPKFDSYECGLDW